jgi:hAT family C-terminal dimerisation region/Domain of unknown function (DUF4413)
MQKKFDKYWENSNLIHTLACVFDPRCKLAFVKFCFRAAYGDATDIYNKNLESVHLALKEFYKDYENVIGNIDRATSSGSPQVEGRIYGKRKLEMRFSQFQSQNQRIMTRNSELDTYLEKELVSFHEENFDILQWWKRNSESYPTLAKMARDFLPVQVSSVASESAFSAAGRLTDHLRSSMSAETIEALVCSKDWFGPDEGNFDLDYFRQFMPKS